MDFYFECEDDCKVIITTVAGPAKIMRSRLLIKIIMMGFLIEIIRKGFLIKVNRKD